MIMTGNEEARNSFGLGESAYEDDIWNLTINTGSGNPGAIALDWVGSNRASVKNVNIQSGDGRGRCGLSVARSSSAGTGPDYVKNVAIKGFDYGIYANADAHEVGNTFEYIDLTNIHTAGVVNGGMPNWFRHVSANMKVPVFVNQGSGGSLLVTDGNFTGGASNVTAIQAPSTSTKGVLFLRNIKTSGYAAALAVSTANKIVPGANISEYAFSCGDVAIPQRAHLTRYGQCSEYTGIHGQQLLQLGERRKLRCSLRSELKKGCDQLHPGGDELGQADHLFPVR
jgi:hypothetical protein